MIALIDIPACLRGGRIDRSEARWYPIGDAFIPASLTVKAGTKVTFINDDDDAHTATADDASWDSEGLNQTEKWTHAFAKAGKIAYHCTVHPMMHGTIIVRSAK